MTISFSSSTERLVGATLLIAGCCIGAGMLGLPVLSGLTGFKPSIFLFCASWLFMAATGFLLLEVSLWFKEETGIISMADATLGPVGKAVGWGGFLFLFYALMVAYIAGSGELIADFWEELTGGRMAASSGCILTSLLLGFALFGGTRVVDWCNRLFMLGLALSYTGLLYFGGSHVDSSLLEHSDWSTAYLVVPAMIISFGYHNMIPTLKTYLQGDAKHLRLAILLGSGLPLIIYVAWEWLILGLIPVEGDGGFRQALGQGDMATRALKQAVGASWIVNLAQYFAFFALITSFLAVSLSFVDFLADGLNIRKDPKGKLLLCFLVLGLPLMCALIYPKIFLVALRYAGSFGAIVLFALLPAAMVWSGRYHRRMEAPQILPGGKTAIIAIVAIAVLVIVLQLISDLT